MGTLPSSLRLLGSCEGVSGGHPAGSRQKTLLLETLPHMNHNFSPKKLLSPKNPLCLEMGLCVRALEMRQRPHEETKDDDFFVRRSDTLGETAMGYSFS